MTIRCFLQIVNYLVAERTAGKFCPILEADLHAFLYHASITILPISAAQMHVNSRVSGAGSADKFDLVEGGVQFVAGRRPAISAHTIIEVKMFADGFTPQQCRRRFTGAIADVIRLGKLPSVARTRIHFLYDELGYLQGSFQGQNRENLLINQRNTYARGVHLVFAGKHGSSWRVARR